jgi:hypothetical protein
MYRFILVATAVVAAAPAAANQAQEQSTAIRPAPSGTSVELSTGLEYQEGEYGTGQKIKTSTVSSSLRISSGRFQFSATLPYLRIDAPGNVVGGGGGVLGLPIIIDPNQPTARARREGLGDLKLGASYTVPSSIVDVSLLGQVKLPTASQGKNLGTGEIDYSVGAELSKSLGGVTPFVGVSYTMPGSPKGYDLRNSLSARGGIATMLAPRVRGYISYGYARSISRLVGKEKQLSTGINAGLSERLSLGFFGTAGLSQGSPDVGAGVQLGVSLF